MLSGKLLRIVAVLTLFHAADGGAQPPFEAYGSLPGIGQMSLSPSGEHYAVIGLVGETRTLLVIQTHGKPIMAMKVGELKVRGLRWADAEHLLVTMSATVNQALDFSRAYEFASVVCINVKNNKTIPIFDKSNRSVATPVFGSYGTARIDGHSYGYFSGITYVDVVGGEGRTEAVFAKDIRELYQVDLDSGRAQRIARSGPERRAWAVAADGKPYAFSEYKEKQGVWQLRSIVDGEPGPVLLEKAAPIQRIALEGMGRTPGSVVVYDDSGDEVVVEEVSVANGKHEKLFPGMDVGELIWDPDTRQLIGAHVREGSGIYFFDSTMQSRFNTIKSALPDRHLRLTSFSHNLDRSIVETDGGKDSGTFWLFDFATAQMEPIGYARPQIKSSDVGTTQMVEYKAADGLKLEGVLTLPPNRKPERLPLVLMPHGGPIGVHDGIGFDWWAQAYASAGYAVFQPNYRGSGGYGLAFRNAGMGEWGRKMQTDLSDGVATLVARGWVDSRRVCIVGASYGGYAALAGVTLQHGLYRCAVSVAGPSDLSSFYAWERQSQGNRRDTSAIRFWHALIGTEDESGELLARLSPAKMAAQADAPVLLIHGKDDTVVPAEQSELMRDALRKAGKAVEYVELKGEDHWLSREATRMNMLKAAVSFVTRNNPPDPLAETK